jgi:hypothetical protein
MNVNISVPVVVVGTYAEPLICFTEDGKLTVAEPVVLTNTETVCPGFILDGSILVSLPLTNCKLKKLWKSTVFLVNYTKDHG